MKMGRRSVNVCLFSIIINLEWQNHIQALTLAQTSIAMMLYGTEFTGERKGLHPFTSEHEISRGFVIHGLYYVEVRSLYIHFVESFSRKGMLSFVRCF